MKESDNQGIPPLDSMIIEIAINQVYGPADPETTSVGGPDEDEAIYIDIGQPPKYLLEFWQKENPGGWAARNPNPFDKAAHHAFLKTLSIAEICQFSAAWNGMLDKFADVTWDKVKVLFGEE